jgi:hypothetical protein
MGVAVNVDWQAMSLLAAFAGGSQQHVLQSWCVFRYGMEAAVHQQHARHKLP